jgi:hypothetical protein
MKSPSIRRYNSSQPGLPDERGVTIILVALSMVGILAMAALSIDVVTLYLDRLEAQRSADAAALTAARIISVSGITGTADPGKDTPFWSLICDGASSVASQAARAVAFQNTVGGTPATSVTVKYSAGGAGPSDTCSVLRQAFAVNPMVTVQVTRTALPTLFSRIWGSPSNSVTATATAEAFNPSNSGTFGNSDTDSIIPVQPRCVKPWIVPNLDPLHSTGCGSGGGPCAFVDLKDGSIIKPGISLGGTGTGGVIGETFNLFADCAPGASCTMPTLPAPQANVPVPPPPGTFADGNPGATNLEYLPGAIPSTFTAVPSCGGDSDYQKAIAGCDQTTAYQCGVSYPAAATPNSIDLIENPGGATGDTATAAACLINQSPAGTGQDALANGAYPYQITAGPANPVVGVRGSLVSSSSSIVSLPIYDNSPATLTFTGNTAPVTIVGFLQVFINQVNPGGSLNVTVLNVAGCGNGNTTPTGTAVSGSSPVPVRLITPP